uniref:Uncharacterized protein n=1 Tax=Utricularia reniformis TaxID=192314 RepID=A0A1Y0B4P1_9LAMI|nr:hypothetical protein AEK19_MT2246 [Utricularia reniformis]ART32391.1 hypothetical protein AEK19_MT2246 [Utricularia reniformis]
MRVYFNPGKRERSNHVNGSTTTTQQSCNCFLLYAPCDDTKTLEMLIIFFAFNIPFLHHRRSLIQDKISSNRLLVPNLFRKCPIGLIN